MKWHQRATCGGQTRMAIEAMKTFLLRFFTWWNSQTFGTQVWTTLYGEFVGEDEFGNRYYRTKNGKIDPTLGFERRWVIYAGIAEASKFLRSGTAGCTMWSMCRRRRTRSNRTRGRSRTGPISRERPEPIGRAVRPWRWGVAPRRLVTTRPGRQATRRACWRKGLRPSRAAFRMLTGRARCSANPIAPQAPCSELLLFWSCLAERS